MLRAWVPVVALILLGGCVAPMQGASSTGEGAGPDAAPRRSVVAVIDTGINPYHVDFAAVRDHPWPSRDHVVVSLAQQGDHAHRVAADAPFWESVEQGRLYAFEGTRVLAITMLPPDPDGVGIEQPPARGTVLDLDGHGTATAGLVAAYDAEAWIVSIQIDTLACLNEARTDCVVSPSIAEAVEWAGAQDWIDVISVSLGLPANAPSSGDAHREAAALVAATRAAVAAGKLVLNAAGNQPTATLADAFAGPPHIVAVGGADSDTRGASSQAGRGVDLVADHVAEAPTADSVDARSLRIGTSYSTPIVAGVASVALSRARSAPGGEGLRAAELRPYLNASATSWGAADYRANASLGQLFMMTTTVPATPGLLGWGHVGASIVDEVVARLAREDTAPPPEKADVARAQAAYQAAREAYWSAWR